MTTETDTRRAAKIAQMHNLLAKADSSEFPGEAESFRAKASELMTKFRVEEWELVRTDGTTREPVERIFDIAWWYNNDRRSDLFALFSAAAYHCCCVIGFRGQSYTKMPVVGLPSDLDYLETMFLSLNIDMANQLEPTPDPNKSFDENAYVLRGAGLNRTRVAELMYKCQLDTGEWAFPVLHRFDDEVGIETLITPSRNKYSTATRAKLRNASNTYADENGLDRTTIVRPVVWQRSFAGGYVNEVRHRLYAMRQAEEKPTGNGPSVALVIRDIRKVAEEVYNRLYPPPPPVKVDPNAKPRKGSYAIGREVAHSSLASSAGARAGRKANLSANPSKGVNGGRGALTP